ncbi:Holliday junction resolvase RecU [Aneurinibacillus migulanus]|uniref:Holliday junction resolvase RecU n=1 Tax=Aneurinibacillus migulanus TaxID=47500 RepID=A0A0D1Y8U7_ANEMI|nr:Holliday junction resolvase RecU [Aneurinibacillus migulanus]KIV55542.1 recombinase RecU [Aneurinibacillus migulanus]KON95839.1 recombinase RecU [Aneurinibacillus migulanus]MED0891921.1 Holliday junction resolvase RecU [Aneurinibacillus migulanus]MED1617339.1 Holliday junction resolvase RecU [Aneurinibacillus migulanus]SDI39365.1 recombination protein U [Aneurinibacillus migulanus]
MTRWRKSSFANRGMAFEQQLDYTNRLYEQQGIAVINKRPTPVKILGRNTRGMVNGYLEKPSTVDYDGTYTGRSVVFEAKSTKELTRFPLDNVHEHQVEYLAKCHGCGAISFMLVEFANHQIVYLLPYEVLEWYWQRAKTGGRGTKSIPLQDFDVHAYQVPPGRVPVDYLQVVEKVWSIGGVAV